MSELGDLPFDPELIALILNAENCYREVDEMSSSIDGSSDTVLAEGVVTAIPPCCQFSGRIGNENREGLSALLELALSSEFRKFTFFVVALFIDGLCLSLGVGVLTVAV